MAGIHLCRYSGEEKVDIDLATGMKKRMNENLALNLFHFAFPLNVFTILEKGQI